MSLQTAKLSRPRNHENTGYLPHPRNAPSWTYSDQEDATYETDQADDYNPDTEYDEYTELQMQTDADVDFSQNLQLSNDERRILINADEEHQTGESSTQGEIRGAILQNQPHLEDYMNQKSKGKGKEKERGVDDDYAPLSEEDYDDYMD